ncbi:MAG: c-type cytochrome [Rhodobacteraceae bacterium]|nr:c-type cytochrome [Paracoccaceae bacterium]MCB1375250.1 c-type cytochrome [Paracoccaceae bacterium]
MEPKTGFPSISALAILVCLLGTDASALDDEAQIILGRSEYMGHCAVCHGPEGKGDGPAAEAMVVEPADLTQIAVRYSGQFPSDQIYRVIDGREAITPHGDRSMPIWGYRYWDEAQARANQVPLDVDRQAIVHGRITALVRYLESIQAQ